MRVREGLPYKDRDDYRQHKDDVSSDINGMPKNSAGKYLQPENIEKAVHKILTDNSNLNSMLIRTFVEGDYIKINFRDINDFDVALLEKHGCIYYDNSVKECIITIPFNKAISWAKKLVNSADKAYKSYRDYKKTDPDEYYYFKGRIPGPPTMYIVDNEHDRSCDFSLLNIEISDQWIDFLNFLDDITLGKLDIAHGLRGNWNAFNKFEEALQGNVPREIEENFKDFIDGPLFKAIKKYCEEQEVGDPEIPTSDWFEFEVGTSYDMYDPRAKYLKKHPDSPRLWYESKESELFNKILRENNLIETSSKAENTYPFTLYSYENEYKNERSEDLVYIYMKDDDDGWWESRCNLSDDDKEFVIKSDDDYDEAMVALESLTSYDLGGKNIFPDNFDEKLFSTGKAQFTFIDYEGKKSKCTMVAKSVQN